MSAFHSAAAPFLPSLEIKSYATHKVWKDSTRTKIQFNPVPKKLAVKIFHDARRFERQTRRRVMAGARGCIMVEGKLGRSGLHVLHALLFDFLNYNSGRLDPSYAAIAERACVSVRTVARCLVRLKSAGILNWVRRCSESFEDGVYQLAQETNAYGVCPPSQWRGYRPAPEPPRPDRDTYGAPPRPPHPFAQAQADQAHGLPTDSPLAPLTASLSRLGRFPREKA